RAFCPILPNPAISPGAKPVEVQVGTVSRSFWLCPFFALAVRFTLMPLKTRLDFVPRLASAGGGLESVRARDRHDLRAASGPSINTTQHRCHRRIEHVEMLDPSPS